MTPYEALAALAERRADLVSAGAWEEAAAVVADLDRLRAALPAVPPASAGPALERALLETHRADALTRAALDETRDELAQLASGRRLAAAYGRS